MRTLILLGSVLILAACADGARDAARLAPRPTEQIDPRVAIPSPPPAPASAALLERLAGSRAAARAGTGPFEAMLPDVRRAAAAAGPAQSESWIAAQQLLSALTTLRTPVASAMADIDRIESETIQARGGIGAGDREAVEAASAEVGVIDARQQSELDSLRRQLQR